MRRQMVTTMYNNNGNLYQQQQQTRSVGSASHRPVSITDSHASEFDKTLVDGNH